MRERHNPWWIIAISTQKLSWKKGDSPIRKVVDDELSELGGSGLFEVVRHGRNLSSDIAMISNQLLELFE